MQVGDLNKVWEIKVLKRKPRQDEAQKFLERIAKQVQPIMRKHNWRVKVLSEMYPKRKELLGLNVGAGIEVKLALRRPNNELEFNPFDEVLDTMLHELCHNAHAPHNASFYKLWDQLRKECEELMAKGIIGTGEGFDLPGKRLGGFSRQPPLSSLRKTALDAAENRQKLNSILPSGPLRIGGDKSIMTALSPVQAAAMAAERRFQDEIWCASASNGVDIEGESNSDLFETIALDRQSQSVPGSSSSVSETSRKRSNTGNGGNLMGLTSDINSTSNSVHEVGHGKRSRGSDISEPNRVSSSENKHDESVMWTCEKCTLLNPALALICEACETLKPKDMSVKYKFWNCRFCTLENSVSLDKCSACDQWRYSRGGPLSALPPNLGT
ncbi:DNA-dependent metalloprotease WSS1-like [Silene latifolia]|uniref:DNA-dependent metalloprotease WSS1-like n=1 Tax=Silene latifolia TaxID=37657 RepID=UPI003D77E028